jgi:RNA polymerase sporulation-specific sigma factor
MDQICDNNDDRNRLDEIALKEAIIGLDYREKNIL